MCVWVGGCECACEWVRVCVCVGVCMCDFFSNTCLILFMSC